MRLKTAEWITLGALALAGLVWAIRLEGRVTAQDRELGAIRQQHTDALAQFRDDLSYIRSRIDQALDRGGLR